MNRIQILGTVMTGAALLAQAPTPGQVVERKEIHIVRSGPAADVAGMTFLHAESSFEAMDVKGAPFSGEFVTESLQVLADGNRIKSSSSTSYARDGEGRTRREMTIDAIGPWAANGPLKSIFIHDPVAKVDYVLEPHTKTARKIVLPPDGGPKRIAFTPAFQAAPAASGPSHTATFERKIAVPDVLIGTSGHRVMIGGPGERIEAGNANFKNEDLGKRLIEGVEASGTKTVVTIPAGQIGNERALETVSERWYSNELKTVVLTTRKDPRSGESTYKLTNLRRGEPSRILFEVPPDYNVVEDGGPAMIRMKVDKKRDE